MRLKVKERDRETGGREKEREEGSKYRQQAYIIHVLYNSHHSCETENYHPPHVFTMQMRQDITNYTFDNLNKFV